jgi:hypothetical protein
VYSKEDKEVIKAMEAVVDRAANTMTLIESMKLEHIKYNSQCPFSVVAGLCLALKRMGVKTDDSITSLRYTADVLEHFIKVNSLEDLDSVFATFQVDLRN